MPTSDISAERLTRSELVTTIGLIVVIASVMLGLAWLVPLETRNASGDRHELSALDIWREMLHSVPADAPVFLNAGVLAVLSLVALALSSYVVVAIARMPR